MSTKSVQLQKDGNLECKTLAESGEGRWTIYVRGTGLNHNASRILSVNGVDNYNTASGRGMRLTIFNSSMVEQSDVTYDIYGVDADRTSLANALNAITDTQIFTMTSWDAIRSNSNLDTAMTSMRSVVWGAVGIPVRRPYVCVGTGKCGILAEQLWPDTATDPYAELEWTYEDVEAIGFEGYGEMLWSYPQEVSYTGTGYGYLYSPNLVFTTLDLYDLEWVRVTFDIKIDLTRALVPGSYSTIFIWSASPTDGWIRSTSYSSQSTEWESRELLFQRNDAADIAVSGDSNPGEWFIVGVYHYTNDKNDGTSYVRNIQVQRCGFAPTDSSLKVKIAPYVITSKKAVESPLSFNPADPDSYYKMFNSDRNLVRDNTYTAILNGIGTSDETVNWFDYDLTASNQKMVMWKENTPSTAGANMYEDTALVAIDHLKYYYGAIWMYVHFKDRPAGSYNYFGTHGYNDTPTNIGIYYARTGANQTNPYFVYPQGQHLAADHLGRWLLVEGWFLPSYTDNTDGIYYDDNIANMEFGGVNSGGYHIDNDIKSGNILVARFRTDNTKTHLRWLDYYNDTYNSKTWWALPMLIEVTPMSISSAYTLYSDKFEESL